MRYKTKMAAKRAAKRLGLKGIHSHGRGKKWLVDCARRRREI
jgi:hypothetical protein